MIAASFYDFSVSELMRLLCFEDEDQIVAFLGEYSLKVSSDGQVRATMPSHDVWGEGGRSFVLRRRKICARADAVGGEGGTGCHLCSPLRGRFGLMRMRPKYFSFFFCALYDCRLIRCSFTRTINSPHVGQIIDFPLDL